MDGPHISRITSNSYIDPNSVSHWITKNLIIHKAAGPDEIPAHLASYILKEVNKEIAPIYSLLYRKHH